MSNLILYAGVAVCVLLLGAVFFGAPYVPTRKKDIKGLFERRVITADDVVTDLGSGDGVLLVEAGKRGIRSYGVELSPILVLVSWLRLRKYRRLAQVRLGNYWHTPLPDDTTVVFVFLADKYMQKLRLYLETESRRLHRPLLLVSYGFELPGYTPLQTERAMLVYKIKP